jgi:hypothetical protein
MLEVGTMADLGQRGPLGQKKPKAERGKKKGLPRVSKKRAAYLSSPERESGKTHMGRVAQLPCLVCGAQPVEVHHEGKPRSDMNCLPLCPPHHRREYGVGAYHYSPKAFYTAHGPSEELLAKTMLMLDK